jgi:Ni/Co efflux regulator RcnB
MRPIAMALLVSASLIASASIAQQPQPRPQSQQAAKPVAKTPWKKGSKLPNPQGHQPVKDPRKQGLSAPKKGQQWVRVDGQYLLITAATGAILAISTAR